MSDPIVAEVSRLPHNKLRLSYGNTILSKQLFEFQAIEQGGLIDIEQTTQISIPIASANPASMLNPAESLLKARFRITGAAVATEADVDNKYIFKGVSSLIKSIQVQHATKSTPFENVDNADMFIQASKSLVDHSFWNSLAYDVDGSIVHTMIGLPNNSDSIKVANGYGEGLVANGLVYDHTKGDEIVVYKVEEVNETILRTQGNVVECEVPIPSGLLSSSNDSLVPLFNLPLKLVINFNTITAAFKSNGTGKPTKVEVELKYMGCVYNVSDTAVAETNALITSPSGLSLDYERVQNVSVLINSGTPSFSYTFPVQNISSLTAVMGLLVRQDSLNNAAFDKFHFYDGSSLATDSYLKSIQWSVGNQYFPQKALSCGKYQYATLHTLSKSALLGNGGSIVYHTDSNHITNYAGEQDGEYKNSLADKFMMNMSFVHMNADAYKSGLSLVNSPLSVYLDFNAATSVPYMLQLFLVYQAAVKITPNDVEVKF